MRAHGVTAFNKQKTIDQLHATHKNIMSEEGFRQLGSSLVSVDNVLDDRKYKSFYGKSPAMVALIWQEYIRPAKTKPQHLLWALSYMKLYNSWHVMAIIFKTSKPTYMKWVWIWIKAMADQSHRLIRWEKRNRNVPEGVWCRVSVDGTDFSIEEPFPLKKNFKSHKFPGAALKYEIAISIYSGDIVWVYGPHRGGKNDITIFKERLMLLLEAGEMVETDRGYKGCSDFVRMPDDCETKAEYKEKSQIRSRHETRIDVVVALLIDLNLVDLKKFQSGNGASLCRSDEYVTYLYLVHRW